MDRVRRRALPFAVAALLTMTGAVAVMHQPTAHAADGLDTDPRPFLTVNPALPAGLAGSGHAGGEPIVLLMGDSTLASLVWYASTQSSLIPMAFTLDAQSCRAVTGPSCQGRVDLAGTIHLVPTNAAEAIASYPPGRFDELVMMAGYDEPGSRFAESVQSLPALARQLGVRHITWLTFRTDVAYVPPADAAHDYSYRSNNILLTQAAQASNGYITLLDWNTYAAGHPELMEADGIHLRQSGAVALGTFIRRAVDALWEPPISSPPADLAHPPRPPTPSGFAFLPNPSRVLDSRTLGDIEGGQAYRVDDIGLPDDATGALVSITSVHPEGAGFLTVYPCTSAVPLTSTLNFGAFEEHAAVTVAALDHDGGFCVYANVRTDVVIDLTGYTTPSSDLVPSPISPVRAVDTRLTTGALPAATATALRLPVGGAGVLLNVTATGAADDGYVTVYPARPDGTCAAPPGTSNVAFSAHSASPARVDLSAPARADGSGIVCAWALVSTQLIVDEDAVYGHGASRWTASQPVRTLDTRAIGKRGRIVVIPTVGLGAGITNVGMTVTAVNPAVDAYVTVYPSATDGSCGAPPTASLVNPEAGTVRANSTVVAATSGVVCAYANTPIDLVVDLVGSTAP